VTVPRPDVPLLEVQDLSVRFVAPQGRIVAVEGVSFQLAQGRTLGIVGETGSGKTVLSRAIMGLLPKRGVERTGRVLFDGVDLTALERSQLRKLWGADIAIVFQDPMTSLNPVRRIGPQITETLRLNRRLAQSRAKQVALDLLASVGIPDPGRCARQYAHQLSGGIRQRVTIAIAMAGEPRLLIADEPTTALDVTVQDQILDLLADQQARRSMAMIFVSHDLEVVARVCDEIMVMYAGRVVEQGPTQTVLGGMRMPYTEALLRCVPRLEDATHAPLAAMPGVPPNPAHRPPGCAFAPRCAYADDRCRSEAPPLQGDSVLNHRFACWHPLEKAPEVAGAEAGRIS
jgi:oligopeptide/dipeptide ABC transporter ATP-binding protein